MAKKNYIRWLREKVGHDRIMLVFSGGCILNDQGQVLLQKRGDSGLWGFPGGAIELGESPEAAAIRETQEETGLQVAVGGLIGIYTDCQMSYPNGDQAHSICIAYELRQTGGQLGSDDPETAALRWFSLDEAPALFCQQHQALWEDLKKGNRGVTRTFGQEE
ncbi:MAG: NUDIX domain-containing protein [Clostridia bacterium]|nr:NUDIX domain-containing protein [Clostridia bacterium]